MTMKSKTKCRKKPPIYPKSKIKLIKLWPYARKKKHELGEVWRVGYYSKKDGLNVIWLVNENGEYNWTIRKRGQRPLMGSKNRIVSADLKGKRNLGSALET